jgi:flagellar basal body-associated protein FliL
MCVEPSEADAVLQLTQALQERDAALREALEQQAAPIEDIIRTLHPELDLWASRRRSSTTS